MFAPPGRDLVRLEAFRPSRTSIVIDIDTFLDGVVAIIVTEGINDKGGSSGAETSHDGDGGGEETHLGRGRDS